LDNKTGTHTREKGVAPTAATTQATGFDEKWKWKRCVLTVLCKWRDKVDASTGTAGGGDKSAAIYSLTREGKNGQLY